MNSATSAKRSPKNGTKPKTTPGVKLKDKNAPKGPRSAYLHFLSERRDFYLHERKEMKYSEVIAAVAVDWGQLSMEQKKIYIDKASEDRERYNKEFLEYQKTNMYKEFEAKKKLALKQMAEKNTSNIKRKGADDDDAEDDGSSNAIRPDDIVIFSDAFMEYNKAQEKRLREIRRKVNCMHEEEVLLKREINRLQENLLALQERRFDDDTAQKCYQLKAKWGNLLLNALSNVAIPGISPANKTVDLCMCQLQEIISKNPNDAILTAVKNAVAHIDFIGP